ncbi:MAG: PAS domain-containing protein [Desulfurivibrionaceae bacterium]
MFRTVFDALPSLIFIVDSDVRIHEYNAAAAELLADKRETIIRHRSGEVLHCIHSREVTEGCGHAPLCSDCIIRNSVYEASLGHRVVRRRTKIEIVQSGEQLSIYALITASPFQFEGRPLVLLVIEDISEIAELQRLIPICSVCKKVRDEKETWSRVEAYFKEKWDVDFSHGLCPECYKIEIEKIKKM